MHHTGKGKPHGRLRSEPALETEKSDPVVDVIDWAGVQADHALVQRCLAGEVDAWEELYTRYHSTLLIMIQTILDRETCDQNLLSELAARVWYALVADDGRLLERFDPRKGARLATFMREITKDVISRYFRAERRRRKRERIGLYGKPQHGLARDNDPSTALVFAEFLTTLTAQEKDFLGDNLLAPPLENGLDPESRSSTSGWQLSHRIREKLTKFLRKES